MYEREPLCSYVGDGRDAGGDAEESHKGGWGNTQNVLFFSKD